MSNIESRVIATIARQLHLEENAIVRDASIAHDLGADSLNAVEIIMALEDEFDLQISDEDAEKITTVRQAIEYITRAIDRRQGLQA